MNYPMQQMIDNPTTLSEFDENVNEAGKAQQSALIARSDFLRGELRKLGIYVGAEVVDRAGDKYKLTSVQCSKHTAIPTLMGNKMTLAGTWSKAERYVYMNYSIFHHLVKSSRHDIHNNPYSSLHTDVHNNTTDAEEPKA